MLTIFHFKKSSLVDLKWGKNDFFSFSLYFFKIFTINILRNAGLDWRQKLGTIYLFIYLPTYLLIYLVSPKLKQSLLCAYVIIIMLLVIMDNLVRWFCISFTDGLGSYFALRQTWARAFVAEKRELSMA